MQHASIVSRSFIQFLNIPSEKLPPVIRANTNGRMSFQAQSQNPFGFSCVVVNTCPSVWIGHFLISEFRYFPISWNTAVFITLISISSMLSVLPSAYCLCPHRVETELSAPPPSKNRTCQFPGITAQAFQRAPLWGSPSCSSSRWLPQGAGTSGSDLKIYHRISGLTD